MKRDILRRSRPLKVAASLIALVAIAGCTVTPEALTSSELQEFAKDRSERIISDDQEPVTKPVTLYEAMARAIKYNLDDRVEAMDVALRFEELEQAEYDMLPDLVASVDLSDRSNDPFSSSVSTAGVVSTIPTRSTEAETVRADLTLSWDILDFGLSYYRAKQRGDAYFIAQEQRRATINRIIENVRTAYWRAAASERLLPKARRLETRVERALKSVREQVASNEGDELEALLYQRELLDTLRSAQEIIRDLNVAKSQLAALMNLRQGQHYHVVVPRHANLDTPVTLMSPEKMVELAYVNRPELREISYRLRSNEIDKTSSALELLPSIRAYLGVNYDSNELLVNNDWARWGARLSWDIMNLARYSQTKKTNKAEEQLLDARALALTQAISTQVYVSDRRFHALKRESKTALEYHNVSDRIFSRVQKQYDAGIASERELVSQQLTALVAELRYDATYAQQQSAFANVYNAVGLDSFDGTLTGRETVAELAQSLSALWGKRGDRG